MIDFSAGERFAHEFGYGYASTNLPVLPHSHKKLKCMFKHTCILIPMVKTITIRDEIYGKLLAVKRKNESFSELFDRLVECRAPIETLKELRGKVEFTEKEQMLSELRSKRDEKRN